MSSRIGAAFFGLEKLTAPILSAVGLRPAQAPAGLDSFVSQDSSEPLFPVNAFQNSVVRDFWALRTQSNAGVPTANLEPWEEIDDKTSEVPLDALVQSGARLVVPPVVDVTDPDELYSLALAMEIQALQYLTGMELEFSELFSAFGTMRTRSKKADSIVAKILEKRKKDGSAAIPAVRAIQSVNDTLGCRLILNPEQLRDPSAFVEMFIKAVKDRKIHITRIRNYRGSAIMPYLSDETIQKIARASKSECKIVIGENAFKPSGFTGLNIDFTYKGVNGDMHVMGPWAEAVYTADHVAYKLMEAGLVDPRFRSAGMLAYIEVLKNLQPPEKRVFQDFIIKSYRYARFKEHGEADGKSPPHVPPALLNKHPYFDIGNFNVALRELVGH